MFHIINDNCRSRRRLKCLAIGASNRVRTVLVSSRLQRRSPDARAKFSSIEEHDIWNRLARPSTAASDVHGPGGEDTSRYTNFKIWTGGFLILVQCTCGRYDTVMMRLMKRNWGEGFPSSSRRKTRDWPRTGQHSRKSEIMGIQWSTLWERL